MTHYDVFNSDADVLRELGICLNYNAMTCIKLPWSGGVIRSGHVDFSFPAAS